MNLKYRIIGTFLKLLGIESLGTGNFRLHWDGSNVRVQNASGTDIELRLAQGSDASSTVTLGELERRLGYRFGVIPISNQYDGASVPNNSASPKWILCTTSGGASTAGKTLAYDDGSNSGACELVTMADGQMVIFNADLTGGTKEYGDDELWKFDAGADELIKKSDQDLSSLTDPVRHTRITIDGTTTNTTYNSADIIPANAKVVRNTFAITTAFDPGLVGKLGHSTDDDALFLDEDLTEVKKGTDFTIFDWHTSAANALFTITGGTVSQGTMAIDIFYING